MCTSTAAKPARSNAARHLDLAVDALLAQDRHARPRAGVDVRRGDVLGRIEGQLRLQARRVEVARARRVPRRRIRGCRAASASRASPTTRRRTARPSATRPASRRRRSTRTTGAVVGRAMRCAQSIRPWRATRSANSARSSAAICTTAPSSSLNSVRNGVLAPAVEVDVEAAGARRTPFRTARRRRRRRNGRGRPAAGRASRASRISSKKARRRCGSSRSGTAPRTRATPRRRRAGRRMHCARIEPPRRCLPAPRPISHSSVSTSRDEQRRELLRARRSTRRERGDDQRHRRHRLAARRHRRCHCACIDSESLPTGMLRSSSGHSSMPTALHRVEQQRVFAGVAGGGHPVRRQLDSDPATRPARRHRLVIASPTAMRAAAAASSSASGVRSPIAIASPA